MINNPVLTSSLKKYQHTFNTVVPFNKKKDKLLHMNFTATNTDLNSEILDDENKFTNYINQKIKNANALYGIGGYAEFRNFYSRSYVFDADKPGEEPRRLHLGIDIWGKEGISDTLKKLKHQNYGKDLVLILFQFYVKPIPYLLQNLKEIENYRRNEKSIGIPIIITDENFFSKSEDRRYTVLKQAMLLKLDLLAEVVTKKKLDTKMELLKADLSKLLDINV